MTNHTPQFPEHTSNSLFVLVQIPEDTNWDCDECEIDLSEFFDMEVPTLNHLEALREAAGESGIEIPDVLPAEWILVDVLQQVVAYVMCTYHARLLINDSGKDAFFETQAWVCMEDLDRVVTPIMEGP